MALADFVRRGDVTTHEPTGKIVLRTRRIFPEIAKLHVNAGHAVADRVWQDTRQKFWGIERGMVEQVVGMCRVCREAREREERRGRRGAGGR